MTPGSGGGFYCGRWVDYDKFIADAINSIRELEKNPFFRISKYFMLNGGDEILIFGLTDD